MTMELKYQDLLITAQADITAGKLDDNCLRIACTWQTQEAPQLKISWRMPIVDVHFLWQPRCGKDRNLPAQWEDGFFSRVSSGAPVVCLYDLHGQNRLTYAISDALSECNLYVGVSEETAELMCSITVSLEGHNGAYEVILRRDASDRRYEQALADVSRWWETFYPPMNVPDIAREPLYSTWYSYHQQTIANELEAECEQAVQDGFGCVIVDDGWQTQDMQRGYAYCGDWEPLKIPDMKEHVARVHALGMKYMLWYSVPFVGKHAKMYKHFEGKYLNFHEERGTATLDPRYPDVREYLIGIYEKAMREWDLDGFKLDFIDSFSATRIAPPYQDGMDCRTVEEGVVKLMTGVKDTLQKLKPDVLIEFRQSYIGPAMRLYGNMFRVGDCPDDLISNRVGMVSLRLLMGESAVHSDMLMWHPEERVENAAVQIQNILFAVPQISVRLAEVPQEHRRMLRFWMQFMHEHRKLLAAPIRADLPQMLYPIIRTRLEDEAAIAVYAPGQAVELDDANTTYLVNAADKQGVIVRSADARKAEVYDCCGEWLQRCDLSAGLAMLDIPLGGYAKITK